MELYLQSDRAFAISITAECVSEIRSIPAPRTFPTIEIVSTVVDYPRRTVTDVSVFGRGFPPENAYVSR